VATYFVLLFILLLLSAFFSSAETAFLSLDRVRLEHRLREGVPGAHLVSTLLERPHRLLSAILLGNNLVNTGAAAVGTAIAAELITGGGGILAATITITLLLVLFGEVTPKTMALSHAFAFTRIYAVPLRFWASLNRPIVAVLDALTRLLIRLFGGEQLTSATALSAAELRTAIRVGAEAGALETEASERMLGALTLEQRQVQEIMVSRMDMVAVPQDQSLIEVAAQLSKVGFQRLPVYAASPDEVTGYIHVSDLNAAHLEGLGDRTARDIMRPAIFQSEHAPIANVLELMRNRGAYLVMLVDEFGVTSGLVTLEDIMEEVVGRIRSESGEEPAGLEEGRRTGRLILDGSTLLVDLSNEVEVDLTDVDANTVAGLMLHHMRRFPDRGEYTDLHGFRFTVLAMDQRRIARVAVEPVDSTVPAQ
jgi:CBS domain containing-hemolysin-like protein